MKTGFMRSTDEVYEKIKEMSQRSANPRPQIPVQLLAREFLIATDNLVLCLTELKKLRLIRYEQGKSPHIRLTLLGYTVTR